MENEYTVRFAYDGMVIVTVVADDKAQAVDKARELFYDNVRVTNADPEKIYLINGHKGVTVD